jgi:hypothetical protein
MTTNQGHPRPIQVEGGPLNQKEPVLIDRLPPQGVTMSCMVTMAGASISRLTGKNKNFKKFQ